MIVGHHGQKESEWIIQPGNFKQCSDPFQNFWDLSTFFFKSVRGMFIWFSERQIKACSALLLLDGEIRSSPQHVIIHDLAIPDERQGHYLHSVL